MLDIKQQANRLRHSISFAAFGAEQKEWGAESAVQWKAGHNIALELLAAIANGDTPDKVVEKWFAAAKAHKDITPQTRSERSGSMPKFSWDPMATPL